MSLASRSWRRRFYARSDEQVAQKDDVRHVHRRGLVAGTAARRSGSKHDPDHRRNGEI